MSAGRRTWSVIALVALVLAGVSVFLRGSAAETAHRAAGEADAAGAMLERLLATVATLETAERGYAFTGKELEAKALQAAGTQVEGALASLLPVITPLAADAPVDRLKVLVAQALDSSRETVRLRRVEGQESGLKHAVSDDDQALSAQLQATAKEIAGAARQRADLRDTAARRQALLWGVAAGVFGLLVLAGIAMALVGKAEPAADDDYRLGARDAGSEVPLSAMLSALDEAVLAIDAHGKVVASNPAADALLGLGDSGAGRTTPALYAPDAGKKTPPAESPLLRALKGQPVRNALLSVGRPNEAGSRRVSVSAKPIADAADGRIRGAVMVIRDAASAAAPAAKSGPGKPESAALAETVFLPPTAPARPPEEVFAKAFDAAPTAIGLVGLDGRLAKVNAAFCRLVGCGPEDLVGRDPGSVVPREDAAREEPLLRGLLAGETPSYEIEKRFTAGGKGKDKGNPRPVRWAVSAIKGPGGEVAGALAFADELREKRTADRSRGGQDLLRLVLDALPIGVWVTDAAGKVTLANPAGRKIWGKDEGVARFEPTEYKGYWADSGKRIEPDEWGALHAIGTGEAQVDKAIEVQRFDGTRKTLLTSAVPYRGGDGAVTGAIVVQQELPANGAAGKDPDAATAELAVLKALVPLCPACENKREDATYWKDVRTYVREHRASLREATCRECSSRAYDLWSELIDEKTIL